MFMGVSLMLTVYFSAGRFRNYFRSRFESAGERSGTPQSCCRSMVETGINLQLMTANYYYVRSLRTAGLQYGGRYLYNLLLRYQKPRSIAVRV